MPLITPAKQEIDFCLRTTKPFHNRKAAQDFFRLIDAYGPNYRPFKYGNYEPMKQIFNDKKKDEIILSWFEGVDLSQEELESRPCNAQLMIKGRPPGKIGYYIGWRNQCHLDKDPREAGASTIVQGSRGPGRIGDVFRRESLENGKNGHDK